MNQSPFTSRQALSRKGFSFTEILFAVLILGVGFIMIAAIFPVSLQQTKLNQDESAAAMIARGAAEYVQQTATDSTMPSTGGKCIPLPTAGANAVRGNLILPSDPRMAWVPMYLRQDNTSYAQLILLPVQIRNRAVYNSADLALLTTPLKATATFSGGFVTVADDDPNASKAVGEGTYIVISNNGDVTKNGFVYRIGVLDPAGSGKWLVAPGYEATYPTGTVNVYVVGRGLVGGVADGLSQEIAAFTTFVNIR